MKKIIATILTSAAIVPMLWVHVAPNAGKNCGTAGYEFAYHPQDEIGHAAGVRATQAFCDLVSRTSF